MPLYEYACDLCRVVYQTRHGVNAPRAEACPRCGGELRKLLGAPALNTRRYTSPTEAKYANLSVSDEIAKEKELQRVYETVWLPEGVKHSPWDRH
jgi:putative FmdB family regulatory protein